MLIVALKTVFSAFSTCKHFASWSKIHSYIVILNTMCRAASPCGRGLTGFTSRKHIVKRAIPHRRRSEACCLRLSCSVRRQKHDSQSKSLDMLKLDGLLCIWDTLQYRLVPHARNHFSGTTEAKVAKFCKHVNYIKCYSFTITDCPQWVWLRSRDPF